MMICARGHEEMPWSLRAKQLRVKERMSGNDSQHRARCTVLSRQFNP